MSGSISVEDVGELCERRGHFEAHVQDLALSLEADVLWPFDHAREVTIWLDVLADAEVLGATFDQGVLSVQCALVAQAGFGLSE